MNQVTAAAAAPSSEAEAHFSSRLGFETDCWDVHDALSRGGAADFVVLDVRGANAYKAGHVPGAVSLPHGDITAERMNEWPADVTLRGVLRRSALQWRQQGCGPPVAARAARERDDRRRDRVDR